MNREIKIIKRAVLDMKQAERGCKRPDVVSPVQLTRAIEEWVRIHRQRACENLALARSFKAAV